MVIVFLDVFGVQVFLQVLYLFQCQCFIGDDDFEIVVIRGVMVISDYYFVLCVQGFGGVVQYRCGYSVDINYICVSGLNILSQGFSQFWVGMLFILIDNDCVLILVQGFIVYCSIDGIGDILVQVLVYDIVDVISMENFCFYMDIFVYQFWFCYVYVVQIQWVVIKLGGIVEQIIVIFMNIYIQYIVIVMVGGVEIW